jgi:hypothetical protein
MEMICHQKSRVHSRVDSGFNHELESFTVLIDRVWSDHMSEQCEVVMAEQKSSKADEAFPQLQRLSSFFRNGLP